MALINETGIFTNQKYFDIVVFDIVVLHTTYANLTVAFPATAGIGQDTALLCSEHENIFQHGSQSINKDD